MQVKLTTYDFIVIKRPSTEERDEIEQYCSMYNSLHIEESNNSVDLCVYGPIENLYLLLMYLSHIFSINL